LPGEDAEDSLSDAWDQAVAEYIERTRFKNTAFVIPGLITVGVAIILVFFHPIAALIGFLVAGGISALVVLSRKKKADAAVAQAVETRDAAYEFSRDIYRDLVAEWVDARIAFTEQDANEAGLLALLERWPALHLEKGQPA
jgi:hypothetical protein